MSEETVSIPQIDSSKFVDNPLNSLFSQRAEMARQNLQAMTPERIAFFENTIVNVVTHIPDVVLVGGWALRLSLKEKGKLIPDASELDLDFISHPDNYQKIKARFQKADPDLSTAFEYGGEAKPQRFPESYIHFTNRTTSPNVPQTTIDIFDEPKIDRKDKTQYELNKVTIHAKSAEESFLTNLRTLGSYITDAQKAEHPVEVQRKKLNYFYMNGEVLDFDNMNKIWEREKARGKVSGEWQETTTKIIHELDDAIHSGKITIIDKSYL